MIINEFFATIYEAPSLYSQALGQHLYGLDPTDPNCQNFTNNCLYNSVGLSMVLVSIFICFSYYKLIDHPRFNKRKHWFLILLINAIVNFVIAFYPPYIDLSNGLICKNIIDQVSTFDCVNFGLINVFYSTIIFVGFSFIFQLISINSSTTPNKQ
ncbi:MAG: hypothetical protein ACOYO1_11260 [Bacteroidales bacterium]